MTMLGSGLLAIWHDIDPALDGDFSHWYTHEHFPERLAVPGFRRGRRYRLLAGERPRFAALYETDTAEVLASAPYIARLDNPTPMSRRMFPEFRNTERSVCRVGASRGFGVGQVMTAFWCGPASALEARPAEMLDEIVSGANIVAAHWLVAVAELTRNASSENRIRGDADRMADRILLVEALAEGAVDRDRLGERIAADAAADYCLIHCASAEEAG